MSRSRTLTPILYCTAMCLMVGSAMIAPPNQSHAFPGFGDGDMCAHLVDKLPCNDAGGPWLHLCKASVSVSCNGLVHMVELSRQLPDHVGGIVIPQSLAQHQANIVRPLGLSLGLGLLTLGRLMYNPCLFYLPAILVGYTAIQPLSPYLHDSLGLTPHAVAAFGAFMGIALACLQRHLVVWLLGLLLGVLAFIALYLGTSYLNTLPIQLLLPVGIAFGLAGSSMMLHFERTHVWKVLACALVGSVLLTDAIGLGALSLSYPFVQYGACTVLVLLSCFRQVSSQSRREQREPEHVRTERRRQQLERDRARRERRRTVGADGRDGNASTGVAAGGSGLLSLLSPPRMRRRALAGSRVEGESAAEMTESEDEGGETEGRGGVPAGSLAARGLGVAWKCVTTCAGLVAAACSAAWGQGASGQGAAGKEKGS